MANAIRFVVLCAFAGAQLVSSCSYAPERSRHKLSSSVPTVGHVDPEKILVSVNMRNETSQSYCILESTRHELLSWRVTRLSDGADVSFADDELDDGKPQYFALNLIGSGEVVTLVGSLNLAEMSAITTASGELGAANLAPGDKLVVELTATAVACSDADTKHLFQYDQRRKLVEINSPKSEPFHL